MFDFADKTIDYVMSLLRGRKKFPQERALFSFFCLNLPEDTFQVVSLKGEEGLNQLYRFEFTLVSENPDLNMDAVLMSEALSYFIKDDPEMHVPVYGFIVEFEQMQKVQDRVYYRALVVPRLWFLTRTYHNQVFLKKTVPEFLAEVLEDGGLTSLDYEFRLKREYNTPREYVCQYQETHFNFFTRWLEREGMYFYFEPSNRGEKVIITDTSLAHTAQENSEIVYSPASGLDYLRRPEVLTSFNLRQSTLPASVTLNDYNYRHPGHPLLAQAQVSDRGVGQVYLYGEHYQTVEEGEALARVKAEGMLCHQKVWHGQSCITTLIAGYTFTLKGHYRDEFNTDYLTTSIKHEGNQAMFLSAGLGRELSHREQEPFYRNTFTAIPRRLQFRPLKTSKTPRFHGSFNAHIDAAGSGQYAEVDNLGRYKVILPFDLSGRKEGKASAWLRMAQPYVGAGHGMHFPLHKGVEVLLSFVEGNPDRPIITGAVPNPESPGVMSSVNQTRAGIRSKGGSQFMIEDKKGQERMILKTGDKGSQISFGVGSPSEVAVNTQCWSGFAGLATTNIAGLVGQLLSIFTYSAMTGFFKLQPFLKLAETLIEATPELIATIVETAAGYTGQSLEKDITEMETLRALEEQWYSIKDSGEPVIKKASGESVSPIKEWLSDILKQRQTKEIRIKASQRISKVRDLLGDEKTSGVKYDIKNLKDKLTKSGLKEANVPVWEDDVNDSEQQKEWKKELRKKIKEKELLEAIKNYLEIRARALPDGKTVEEHSEELKEKAESVEDGATISLGVMKVVYPLIALSLNIVMQIFEARRVEKHIHHAKNRALIMREPAILLANMKAGNVFHMTSSLLKSKRDIAIMTEQGQVQIFSAEELMTLSDKNTQIQSGESIEMLADESIELSAEKEIEMTAYEKIKMNSGKFELSVKAPEGFRRGGELASISAQRGDIKIITETSGDIILKTETSGDISIGTETGAVEMESIHGVVSMSSGIDDPGPKNTGNAKISVSPLSARMYFVDGKTDNESEIVNNSQHIKITHPTEVDINGVFFRPDGVDFDGKTRFN